MRNHSKNSGHVSMDAEVEEEEPIKIMDEVPDEDIPDDNASVGDEDVDRAGKGKEGKDGGAAG